MKMKSSSRNAVKTILCVLAVVCVVLAIIFTVTHVNAYNKEHPDLPPVESYDDYSGDTAATSDGDIQFDDNGTMEMDSIPSGGDVAPAAASEE